LAWRETIGIFLEYPFHDGSLAGIDLTLAGGDGTIIQNAADNLVTVAVATRNLTRLDAAALSKRPDATIRPLIKAS
jgi:hypothetical protein